jgi:transposase
MHVLSDVNGLPLLVGVSAGNTHDSEGLKPMIAGHQTIPNEVVKTGW